MTGKQAIVEPAAAEETWMDRLWGLGNLYKSDDGFLMTSSVMATTSQNSESLRYQLGLSDEDTGLSVQRRYEREVGGAGGDVYNAFYLGLNYFLFDGKDVDAKPEQKHRLKLMGGVEYAKMDGPTGYDGWTALAGVRVFW